MRTRPSLPLSLTPLDSRVDGGGNGGTYLLRDGRGYWRAKIDWYLQRLDLTDLSAVEAKRQAAIFRLRWIELERQIASGRSNPALLQCCAWPEAIRSGPGPNGEAVSAIIMQDVTGGQLIDCFLDRKSRRKYFPAASDFNAVQLTASLAHAVAVVHAAGYLVRDFQPMNVMVTPDYRAVLIDADSFIHKDAPELIRTDLVYFPWRAPELVDIDEGGAIATENHDLFALAQMLFAILMGETHAFDAFLIDKTRDPDIERWIRDCQFPHSMRRPMREAIEFSFGCPPFSALPEAIRELFERAFAPEGKRQRPTAAEWLNVLNQWLRTGVSPWSMAPAPPPPPPVAPIRKAILPAPVMQPPPIPPKKPPAVAAPVFPPPVRIQPQQPAAPAPRPAIRKQKTPMISSQLKATLASAWTVTRSAAKAAQQAFIIMTWLGLMMAGTFFLNSLPTSMTTGPFAPTTVPTPQPNLPPPPPAIPPDEAAWSALTANPTFRGMYEFHKTWPGNAKDTPDSYAALFAEAAERNGVTRAGNQWRTHSDFALYALPDEASDRIGTIPAETTFTALGQMTYYGTWVIVSLKEFGPDGAWEYGFLRVTRSDRQDGTGGTQSSFTNGVY